jgi:hypothetical protein
MRIVWRIAGVFVVALFVAALVRDVVGVMMSREALLATLTAAMFGVGVFGFVAGYLAGQLSVNTSPPSNSPPEGK